MIADGFYVLAQDVKNTVCGKAYRGRWEYLKTFKKGMEFRVVTNIPYGTKHLSPVRLFKGWNVTTGPLFDLIAPFLTKVEA